MASTAALEYATLFLKNPRSMTTWSSLRWSFGMPVQYGQNCPYVTASQRTFTPIRILTCCDGHKILTWILFEIKGFQKGDIKLYKSYIHPDLHTIWVWKKCNPLLYKLYIFLAYHQGALTSIDVHWWELMCIDVHWRSTLHAYHWR
jgi:hypothetical protein